MSDKRAHHSSGVDQLNVSSCQRGTVKYSDSAVMRHCLACTYFRTPNFCVVVMTMNVVACMLLTSGGAVVELV